MCECARRINEQLVPHGAELDMAVVITKDMGLESRFKVVAKRTDRTKRKPLPPVFASFCPFCGENSRQPRATGGDA